MSARRAVRVLYPHQLFEAHLDAAPGTRFVLVEDDLLFRHQPFHAQKLVLHRASGRHFAARLRDAGFDVDVLETDAVRSSGSRLADHLATLRPDTLTAVRPGRRLDAARPAGVGGRRRGAVRATGRARVAELPHHPGRAGRLVRGPAGEDGDLLPVAAAPTRRAPRRRSAGRRAVVVRHGEPQEAAEGAPGPGLDRCRPHGGGRRGDRVGAGGVSGCAGARDGLRVAGHARAGPGRVARVRRRAARAVRALRGRHLHAAPGALPRRHHPGAQLRAARPARGARRRARRGGTTRGSSWPRSRGSCAS